MSKSETIEALASRFRSYGNYASDDRTPYVYAVDMEEAIYKGEIPGIAKQSHDGTTCWMCPVCHKTRDGKRCVTCLEAERDAFKKSLNSAKAATYRAMVVMGLGTEPDDGPDGRWPCGTDVIDALIAEHAKFKESLAKTEAERDALRAALEHALIGMEIGCNIAYRKWAEDDEDESWSIMRDHVNNIHASLAPPTSTTPDAKETK